MQQILDWTIIELIFNVYVIILTNVFGKFTLDVTSNTSNSVLYVSNWKKKHYL